MQVPVRALGEFEIEELAPRQLGSRKGALMSSMRRA